MVDFQLTGTPIVLDSFYRAEPFAVHFISQVVDDIVDTVRKGQRLFGDKDTTAWIETWAM